MPKYLAVTGGVGGAKLARGLMEILPAESLAFIVNTGDDFRHINLHISPDLDSLMYALSDKNNPETGWGQAAETWSFIENFRSLGGEDWFSLGDKDLAVHTRRTLLLQQGFSLSEVTSNIFGAHGIEHTVWPMTDDPVATTIVSKDRTFSFQEYFVKEKCAPPISEITFKGSGKAKANRECLNYINDPDLAGIIICPSNPFLSIDPILAIPELHKALSRCEATKIAVSPIVGGDSLKGPTAKIMNELNLPLDTISIATHYKDLVTGLMIDNSDSGSEGKLHELGFSVSVSQTIMRTLDDKKNLAQTALNFIEKMNR